MKLPECREQEKSLVKRQQGLADQGNGGGRAGRGSWWRSEKGTILCQHVFFDFKFSGVTFIKNLRVFLVFLNTIVAFFATAHAAAAAAAASCVHLCTAVDKDTHRL